MSSITTKDGVEIFYKDWGKGQPIVFSHGWPLSADDWDAQMMFFLGHGYRVIAHDRRGHGRSTQTGDGHDMDHYADDLAALTAHLNLKDAVHVGHSTGGGEVVHYLARHGESRVAKAVIISAVPPLMVKTAANPGGLPKDVFDGFQAQLAANRAQFFYDVPAGPFYGYNRPGAKPSQGVILNWWRQGMMGGAKAHSDGIVAFSQTDFTEDLKKISVPVLVMHGDDDQIVPYPDSAPLSAKLLKNSTLKTYKGFPHGMPTTEADTINADLLKFLTEPHHAAAPRAGSDVHSSRRDGYRDGWSQYLRTVVASERSRARDRCDLPRLQRSQRSVSIGRGAILRHRPGCIRPGFAGSGPLRRRTLLRRHVRRLRERCRHRDRAREGAGAWLVCLSARAQCGRSRVLCLHARTPV
jgi:non-heme chloroperoxidase